ncbi:MAG TPA: gluconate 2-dehydrogenase subunit 3 family protein [Candidatus Acidoferrum sp.]
MNRRDALRMLTAGAVLPALTPELFAFYRQVQPGAGYTLRTLNSHQNDTVVAMIDQIIPATDTPGAKAARVNEFIDVILTEWANDEERRRFLDGLTDVDKQSNVLFGKTFASASSEQQLNLLLSMDEASAVTRSKRNEKSPPIWEPEGRDSQMQGDFFSVFKNMTLHGYYTSEIGFTQELKLQIIPGAQHGCMTLGPGLGDA